MEEAAYILNRGLIARELPETRSVPEKAVEGTDVLPEEYSFVSCAAKGVYIETVKKAENGDGIVLRLFEAFRETKEVTLCFGREIGEAFLCNLSEDEEKKLPTVGNSLTFTIKPFEIVTIKVK